MMISKKQINFLLGVCCSFFVILPLHAQEKIQIVGSSTVFPFSTAVAEEFGALTTFPTPTIESTGSGGGIKLFCGGVGTEFPDIVNASRQIKPSEIELCKSHGVTEISEVIIGYDGIVIASANVSEALNLNQKDLFLALAAQVQDPQDETKLIHNPYTFWDEINPKYPHKKIEVLGPPPTSGTRDAFVELVMHKGCKAFPLFQNMSKKERKTHCGLIREDGVFVDAGENDNLIIQKIVANPDALGIFGFSFLDRNGDKIVGHHIEGVEPTFENIADGSYPVSRSLYFYVKRQHIGLVPGIKEFVAEFFREKAIGEGGYLEERGLIPLPADLQKKYYQKAKEEGIL